MVKDPRFPVILMGRNQSREPEKVTHNAGRLDGPYRLCFSSEGTIGSGKTSLHDGVSTKERGNVVSR